VRSENSPSGQDGRSFIEAARRAQIVECAIDTISAMGYAQASLSQIAKTAGVSKGVISYHFSDKDELIQQVVREILRTFESFMRPRIEAERDPRSTLRAYIETNVAYMKTHRRHVMVLVDILTNARREDGKPLIDPCEYESGLKALEQILIRGQKSLQFRDFSTRVMATSIRNSIDGVAGQMVTNPKLDLDSYARELALLFELATVNEERKPRGSHR